MDKDIRIYTLPRMAAEYPKPCIPMLPTLSPDGLGRKQAGGSRFLESDALFLSSGRVALANALSILGLQPGDEVLIPAYNCGSMLEPILWHRLQPVFYPLAENLQVDWEQLADSLSERTRVLLLTHFFALPQDLLHAKMFCRRHRLILIEDCAHCFWGERDGQRVGAVGDLSIASTMKFFPGIDGGVLISNHPDYSLSRLHLRHPSLRFQLKAIHNLLEQWRWRPPEQVTWGDLAGIGALQDDEPPNTRLLNQHYFWFDPLRVDLRASWVSRWVITHSDVQMIRQRRRRNYRLLAEQLSGLKGLRLLFPKLPENVTPYVLPVYVEQPHRVFPRLKMLGVPIWRWEELVISSCRVSSDYRLKVLQLPCHQGLSDSQVFGIARIVKDVVIQCAASYRNGGASQSAINTELKYAAS